MKQLETEGEGKHEPEGSRIQRRMSTRSSGRALMLKFSKEGKGEGKENEESKEDEDETLTVLDHQHTGNGIWTPLAPHSSFLIPHSSFLISRSSFLIPHLRGYYCCTFSPGNTKDQGFGELENTKGNYKFLIPIPVIPYPDSISG
jgi:hypothetical protein